MSESISRYCPGGFEDPYALALGAWKRINFSDTRYLHHMYDRDYNGIFGEVSYTYTPKRVEPSQYYIKNNCIFKLPYEAATRIYTNDLIHSFLLLYDYISSVIKDAHEIGENRVLFYRARSIEKAGLCNKPGSNCLVTIENDSVILKNTFSP